ncbi:porin [Verrucomicrobia bacterium]|nr:porin [Verrucomicrobiota bacterium]
MKFQAADGETWKGEVGGRFHWDVSGYDEDGDVNGGTEFRRLRLSSEGEFGLAAPLYYKADVDFAGNDSVMKDVYVGFKNLPLISDIRLGHIKEPFSMEELGSSKHMGHVERASLNEALVPSRNNSGQISDTAFDDRMGWAAGWFAEVDRTNINEIDGNHHFTGRLFGVPYLSKDEQTPNMWLSAWWVVMQIFKMILQGTALDLKVILHPD